MAETYEQLLAERDRLRAALAKLVEAVDNTITSTHGPCHWCGMALPPHAGDHRDTCSGRKLVAALAEARKEITNE